MENMPSTEFQSLSTRISVLEDQFNELTALNQHQFAVLSTQNKAILAGQHDLLEAWNGAKTVVSWARAAGK